MTARYDLDNRGGLSKYQYLHRCIRSDIRNGILEVGSCLPTKRSLAAELSVSVSTVEHAYSLLVSEGYLEAKPEAVLLYVRAKQREPPSSIWRMLLSLIPPFKGSFLISGLIGAVWSCSPLKHGRV